MTQSNADPLVQTDHLQRDLKRHSIRGGTATMIAQGCKFILQLGATIVLARLLTPEDYGLFSIVISATTFVNLFKDMGLVAATVQSPTLDQKQASALFWINLALGFLLAVVTALAAPWIAIFFREPRLRDMILAMAVTYIFSGITNQHWALLNRQMRFLAIAAIDVTAMAVGVGTGIAAGWYGMGYWSLVMTQIVIVAVRGAGGLIAVRWLPSLPQTVSIRRFIAMGGHLTGVSALGYVNRNLDNLLIGWTRGARELGFYDKAYQLILLPVLQINFPISNVAISTLSRLQNDSRRYRDYFSQIVLICASLGMPLIVFLFATADQTILLVLGNQWGGAVPLFRALAPAAFVDTFASAINWMFLSLGQTARQLRSAIAVSVALVIAIVVGVQWGAIGVAISFSIARVVVILPHLIYACQKSPMQWVEVLRILVRPAFASIGAALLLMFANGWMPNRDPLLLIVLFKGVLFCAFYLALWVLQPGGRLMLANIGRWVGGLVENQPPNGVRRVTH